MGPEPSGLLGCLKLEFQLRVSGCIRVELAAYRLLGVQSWASGASIKAWHFTANSLGLKPKCCQFWVNGVWGLGRDDAL